MVVHTRARELLEWLLPQAAKFPREHRHTLARHVAELALGIHDALIAARHLDPATRAGALRDADIQLDQSGNTCKSRGAGSGSATASISTSAG